MTNREAYLKAVAALDRADDEQSTAHTEIGGGWGAMDSDEIYRHILWHLARAFKQKVQP